MTDSRSDRSDSARRAIPTSHGEASVADGRPPAWQIAWVGANAEVRLSGDWLASETGVPAASDVRRLVEETQEAKQLRLEGAQLGRWDGALIAFLLMLHETARKLPGKHSRCDLAAMPAAAQRLLALAIAQPPHAAELPRAHPSVVEELGRGALRAETGAISVANLVGEATLRIPVALRGKVQTRWVDVLQLIGDAGADALPIVAVVNGLVGAILALVAVVELQRFGAQIYVADLVGIAMVREMAPIMTAIVMAGRTGGAYAAQLATMQGNEEIDALKTFGISVYDFLVMPRILAMSAMMPLLFVYGFAIGMLGGLLVASSALHLSPWAYITELQRAVSGTQFVIGATKSVLFGLLIAVAGCYIGLSAGRSAADTGRAATRAVVTGIVGVIAVDMVYAACANVLGV